MKYYEKEAPINTKHECTKLECDVCGKLAERPHLEQFDYPKKDMGLGLGRMIFRWQVPGLGLCGDDVGEAFRDLCPECYYQIIRELPK